MARIAKSDVHAALRRAADQLIAAGGADQRISRADVKQKLETLTGIERTLVDLFYRFIDHRDYEAGAVVTVTDVEESYAYATEHLIDAYDKNENGLSSEEIAKMSTIAKLAVALAVEQSREGIADLGGDPERPIYIAGFEPRTAEAELATLTAGLTLASEASAQLRPIVVPLAPSAALDLDTVRRLFADVHAELARDLFGPDAPDREQLSPIELREAVGEERDFGAYFVQRRMPEDLEDPLAVERAVRTGELIDYLAANVARPRVFAYAERLADGRPRVVSLFIVGRNLDGWLLGVYTAAVER